jgi:hypothetical protein
VEPEALKKRKIFVTIKATLQSLVTDKNPLIGIVVRMTVTVHRQLDFSKPL